MVGSSSSPFHPSALMEGSVRDRKWEARKGWSHALELVMQADLEAQGWHVPAMDAWAQAAAGYLPLARFLPPEVQADPHGYVLRCFRDQGLVVEDRDGVVVLRDPAWFDFGVQAGLPF